MTNPLHPVAWIVNDRVFKTLYEAEQYQRKFTHHAIKPLYTS